MMMSNGTMLDLDSIFVTEGGDSRLGLDSDPAVLGGSCFARK